MEDQVCSFNWEPFKALYKSSLPKTTPRRFWFNLNNSPNTPSCQRGQHNLALKQRQFWMSTKLIWRAYLIQHLKLLESCATVPPALALYPIAFVHEILKFVVWLMTTRQKWVLTRPILGKKRLLQLLFTRSVEMSYYYLKSSAKYICKDPRVKKKL